MKTLLRSLYLLLAFNLIIGCGKEELTFNPDIGENSSFEELLETTSFFDRKETTFVMSEEEYKSLIISRDSTSFVFTGNEIFDDLGQYTHITYPYFSATPQLFFMGKVENFSKQGDNVTLQLSEATYTDLFDDYLINTSLPNGYATTRDECIVDLSEEDDALLEALAPSLIVFSDVINTVIKSSLDGTFLEEHELTLSPRGQLEGCVTYIQNQFTSTVQINGFQLINFGIELSYAKPGTDFPRLKSELRDLPVPIYFPSYYTNMKDNITGALNAGNKNVKSVALAKNGVSLLALGGTSFELSGDFILNNIAEINTTQILDISISLDRNTGIVTQSINGNPNSSLSQFLSYNADCFLGAKAGLEMEALIGLGFGDIAGLVKIGFLFGEEVESELRGQIGTFISSSGDENYLDGCAEFRLKDNAYLFGEVAAVNQFFEEIFDYEVPNTIQIYDHTLYDIATDPYFIGPNPTISYTSFCHPDNCNVIDEQNSSVVLTNQGSGNFDVSYNIMKTVGNAGTFDIILSTPTREEVILADGNYNTSATVSTTINDTEILDALSIQDTRNLSISIRDIFNDCKTPLPAIIFSNQCETDFFVDENTGLTLRAFHIAESVDNIKGTCYTNEDPIWNYRDESPTALQTFNADYLTINYMSYERCECYAQKLTDDEHGTFVIPTAQTITSFATDTYDYDYSMIQGGNSFCGNFLPSGFITKAFFSCNDFINGSNSLVFLYNDGCITDKQSSFFHVNNEDSDGLNDYLFQIDPAAFITVKEVAKGTLAPCRLQKI